MENILKIVAQNIRKARKARRLTQVDLARMSGLHRTFIGGIERRERNITLQTLAQIANALNVAPHELLKENNLKILFI